jgi:DNA-binding transcriptional ArsR family regulator
MRHRKQVVAPARRTPDSELSDDRPASGDFSCSTGFPLVVRVLQIATVGENPDAVFVGIRSFPTSKLILVHTTEFAAATREVARRTAGIKLPTELRAVEGQPLIACLGIVSEIVHRERMNFDDVIINTGAGPRMMTCSLLAAAFVNGIRAIDVMGDQPIALPVLKFSYTELVTEAKLRILKTLEKLGGEAGSLEDLVKSSGLEKSLLSYHIRGGRDSRGLETLGLVEVNRGTQGRLGLRITPSGHMMLIAQPEIPPAVPHQEPPAREPR